MTERIKDALDKAREQRQQHGGRVADDTVGESSPGSKLGSDRILAREPFRRFSTEAQRRLLESARVLNVGAGDALQFAGDRDACVHYLLSGVVRLDADGESTTIDADEERARRPLDTAGVKSHSITANTDAELLKVPLSALPDLADDGNAAPVPREDYTDTFSGQQLAALVDQIDAEHRALDDRKPSIVDPKALLASDIAEDSLNTLAAATEQMLGELEFDQEESVLDDTGGYEPKIDDEIGAFARDLEARFRRYVDQVRAEERARYDAKLQEHARRLQAVAQQQVRAKLTGMRTRYQSAMTEKDRRLRERYRQLRAYANKLAQQKAAIYAARRQIGDKLRTLEQIHAELFQLGSQLDHQLEDLDDLMPVRPVKTGSE